MDNNLADLSSSLTDVADVLELATRDPLAAADLLDKWAEEVKTLATQLRENTSPVLDTLSQGGTMDRVSIRTVGPDGNYKQYGGN